MRAVEDNDKAGGLGLMDAKFVEDLYPLNEKRRLYTGADGHE